MAMSVSTFSSRTSTGLAVCRSRRSTVRVAASSEVPPNVADARAWIAAWRSKQDHTAPAAESTAATPAHKPTNGKGKNTRAAKPVVPTAKAATEGPAPAKAPAKPKHKFGPSKSFEDGTLLFTADQLTAVNYRDVKTKHRK